MRPNILMIMADQFRTDSLTGKGGGVETPNIDRILNQGMWFSEAACTAPLCTPSRASLATGKYPCHCGVMVHDADLPKSETTYYQLLRESGYRVGVVGKTDLHKTSRYLGRNAPLPVMYHLGFTDVMETEGKLNAAMVKRDEQGNVCIQGPYQKLLSESGNLESFAADYMERLINRPAWYVEKSPIPDEYFQDAIIGRMACDYLETVDDDVPWHLMISFVGPHNPWDPPGYALERVKDQYYPHPPVDTMEGKPEWIRKRAAKQGKDMTPKELEHVKSHYAASVSVIDEWVGCVLDMLEERNLSDNTVIVFCADHGELLGDHGLFHKTAMYEGALRIPLVIRTPEMKEGSVSYELAELSDLAPTFLDLAGVAYNADAMDAKTLLPLLQGRKEPLRSCQMSELRNMMMLYDGRYKWIRNFNDSDELYDLEMDPDELHNIIRNHPEIIKRLQRYTFRQ